MRQLIYALRLTGTAAPIGVDGNVLQTIAGGPGCTIQSEIGGTGLDAWLIPGEGGEARFESEIVFTGANTYQETGTIAFGPGDHVLTFSTLGTAYLGPRMDDNCRHGAAIWRVDGGQGQFEGAHGLIVSTLTIDNNGGVTDHQLGTLYIH